MPKPYEQVGSHQRQVVFLSTKTVFMGIDRPNLTIPRDETVRKIGYEVRGRHRHMHGRGFNDNPRPLMGSQPVTEISA